MNHSYDPRKLFNVWLSCLRPRGVMALEWTRRHGARAKPTIPDPLNVPLDGLKFLLEEFCRDGRYKIVDIAADLPKRELEQTFFLVLRVH